MTEAGCWAHARRKLFELADIAAQARSQKQTAISPIAFEAVAKFDAIFLLERAINGLSPEARVAARRKDVAPLVHDLIDWMKRERSKLSRHEAVYTPKCLVCHGEKGAGKPNDSLVGGHGTLAGDQPPVKTVGSFWPYATTLFDYVRRAMPLNESKSLTNDEVYAVVAYLLQLNGIIGENETINAQILPRVQMPNRDGFMTFSRGK